MIFIWYNKRKNGGGDLHTKLTLQEKLRDLRDERKLKLSEVEQATGISVPTLSRFETDEYTSIAYQDLLKLATFYGVSMDYLSGMTNHRQYRNVEIDKLSLTDEAVEVLKNKKANNRLISELLTQEDFIELLSTIEIYLDNLLSSGVNAYNATLKVQEQIIQKRLTSESCKENIQETMKEAYIEENEYLRFRISERFNTLLKTMHEAKKSPTNSEIDQSMGEQIDSLLDVYYTTKNSEKTKEFTMIKVAARNLGINLESLTEEQFEIFSEVISNSTLSKQLLNTKGKGRKHKKW